MNKLKPLVALALLSSYTVYGLDFEHTAQGVRCQTCNPCQNQQPVVPAPQVPQPSVAFHLPAATINSTTTSQPAKIVRETYSEQVLKPYVAAQEYVTKEYEARTVERTYKYSVNVPVEYTVTVPGSKTVDVHGTRTVTYQVCVPCQGYQTVTRTIPTVTQKIVPTSHEATVHTHRSEDRVGTYNETVVDEKLVTRTKNVVKWRPEEIQMERLVLEKTYTVRTVVEQPVN